MVDILKRQETVARLMEFWALQHAVGEGNRKHARGRSGAMLVQGQGKILLALTQGDHMAQKDLANELGLTAQSTAEFVRKLEKKGFVTRERLETDRRVTVVSITDAGRSEAAEAMRDTMPYLGVLNDEELDQLSAIFSKINAGLSREIEDAEPSWIAKFHQAAVNHYLDGMHEGELDK